MFNFLFWFQINNMSHSLGAKIQVIILMEKYESLVIVIRKLQRRGTTNISERHAITSIYHEFFETSSVGDRVHIGRPSMSKSLAHTFLRMKQSTDKIIFKCEKNYFYPIV